ncbi:Predicted arabinose efflux permease, MFS family [Xaviernesmea oryzae]|uniref:Predicted arabinose efflux permease, MFS family n=1 Tax=Xaviernesmea oryzae TaxID=464029 RepID=A0A1X7GTF5_9HYPH|nr:MFS transporter [Xaviernesmea oryzae]SMF74274.1 Predicted arabinose efflux permease, MFS family [Xaviernesmea oryzae]
MSAHTDTSSAAKPVSQIGRNVTLLSVSTLTIMSGATISASLPGIAARFADMPNVELLSRLVLTLPALFIAAFAPVAGLIIDRYGRKPMLIATLVLFALAGCSGLLADSLPGLLIGRAVLGIAVGGIMTTGTALVGDFFAGPARDRYMGLQQAFVGIGGAIFLTGGGFLAEVHWRAPFLIYALAFLLLPAALIFIRESVRVEPVQAAMPQAGLGSRGGLLLTVLLIGAVFNMICFYMIPTQLPFFLKSIGLDAPSLAGMAIGLGQLVGIGASLVFARFRQALGVMGVFGLAFGSLGLAFVLLSFATDYVGILFGMAVSGIGMGTIMPNFAGAAMMIALPQLRGRISGLLVASIFTGQFLSPILSQPVIGSAGYAATYGMAGMAMLVVAFASLAVRLGPRIAVRAEGGRS